METKIEDKIKLLFKANKVFKITKENYFVSTKFTVMGLNKLLEIKEELQCKDISIYTSEEGCLIYMIRF